MPDYDIKSFAPGGGRQLKEDSYAVNLADKSEEVLGGKGFDIITDTNAHTPGTGYCYVLLDFKTDTVFSAYTVDSTAPIDGTLLGVTWKTPGSICGKFTSVTLTSGSVIAYRGVL